MPKKVKVNKPELKKKPKVKDNDKENESKNEDEPNLKEKLKKRREKKSFEEQYVRVTTYLEKPVREKMKLLKDKNVIESYTQLINLAIKHYIAKHLD
jgi:bisphosphoglycerate-dependent phosphoglycerate mutase